MDVSRKVQPDLFPIKPENGRQSDNRCDIVSVGKRRDGGTRYWCLTHKADGTAKYGRPADTCRAAHIAPISDDETLSLNVDDYAGGVALWGAVPPIYDTTRLPLDRGIHVHARKDIDGKKNIDQTYRAVRLLGKALSKDGVLITEIDAIYYMVSAIYGFEVHYIPCTLCGYPHLDKDWFSVHPHRRHLCAGCGKHFRDDKVAIGNPVRAAQDVLGMPRGRSTKATRKISIAQRDYPGGIQIWGSNPAIIWSADKRAEEGIHLHLFSESSVDPIVDDTFDKVEIDGIELDPLMVRTFMAQSGLPHIAGRVHALACTKCSAPAFDTGEASYTPSTTRRCLECKGILSGSGRLRNVISNPMPAVLQKLEMLAVRSRQSHKLDLLPETI